jgi:hypothetical protein
LRYEDILKKSEKRVRLHDKPLMNLVRNALSLAYRKLSIILQFYLKKMKKNMREKQPLVVRSSRESF